jgi:chitinase
MRSIVLIQALVASMGSMAHAAFADSYAAQQALQSYLDKNPISTRSAENSQATMSLESLKESVLAGNYSLTRSWGFLLESCPGSCTDLGVDSQAWPVYHSVDRLSRCDETMILSFALYNNLAVSNSQISIRGCTADLQAGSTSYDNSSCEVPVNTTTVTSSLQLAWNTAAATGSVSEAIDSMEQLLAYENMNSLPCNETIKFAYSGQTSVGVYMGSALHRQGLLPSVIQDFIDQVKHEDVTRTQLVQLCDDEKSARYTMGIIINSAGDLSATQQAVQTWRNGSCVTTLESTSTWNNLTFSTPMTSHRSSNATYNWNRRNTERKLLARDTCTAIQVHGGDTCTSLATECGITTAELTTYNPSSTPCTTALTVGEWICCTSGSAPDYTPSPDADGTCYSYTVKEGDDCSALAATYTITVDDIESYNLDTWGWMGCGLLFADMNICLSSGYAPMPAVISNAVCGPQVNGTATVPHGTDLSTINQCPLNACCDKWGQCGITSEFCTQVNSTINAPGTSANGTNGCISNCGTHIIESDAPSEYFTIGYFEGFDLERACLRPLITEIDTTNYTHIHMSFATLNADFSFNISSIETQMDAFTDLLDVKRVVSVGGWAFSTDPSTYDIFREAVSTDVNRATLVTNTLNFLDQYGLDGIDWDWEYPSEPDIPGIPADSTDSAQNLFLFLMDLYQQMPAGKTVSTTAPSSYWYMKQYPIEAISKVVHYIVMMTYDMHGQWDWNNTQTEDQCPTGSCLRSHVNLTETLSAMSMITKAGVPSNMVALGVASYARSFQMTEAGCYGPDCFFTGPDSGATPGVCTNTAGYISNAELYGIADEQSIYTYIDADSNSNIMIWNDTQWAAFMEDSVKDTRRGLYKQMSFLGTADWAIDLLEGNLTATTPACEIYIDPTVWSEASPTITGEPGCTLIWPPKPLASNTTITFPPWPTHLTWQSGATSVTTFYSGASPVTYESISTISVPTLLSIPPRKCFYRFLLPRYCIKKFSFSLSLALFPRFCISANTYSYSCHRFYSGLVSVAFVRSDRPHPN